MGELGDKSAIGSRRRDQERENKQEIKRAAQAHHTICFLPEHTKRCADRTAAP